MTDHQHPAALLERPPSGAGSVAALVEDTLAAMAAELDVTVVQVSAAMHAGGDGPDDQVLPATRACVQATLEQLAEVLARGAGPARATAPDAALAYARTYVRAGLPLPTLTRALRRAQQAYSRAVLQQLQRRTSDVGDLTAAMASLDDRLFGYMEAVQVQLEEAYAAEQERHGSSALVLRAEEVRAVLFDPFVDLAASSVRLRYRLDGRHLGFVVWHGAGSSDAAPAGDELLAGGAELASDVFGALGAAGGLLVPLGPMLAGWAPVTAVPEELELPRGRDGLRIAAGSPGRGLDGFRRTHREALAARRVASLLQRPSTACVPFAAVALEALMTEDLAEAQRFVAHELGALLDDSDASRRVVATLDVFLQEGSSFVRAARRLGVHENTVAYRVRRAEALLGRKVTERQLELRAALRLARYVPSG